MGHSEVRWHTGWSGLQRPGHTLATHARWGRTGTFWYSTSVPLPCHPLRELQDTGAIFRCRAGSVNQWSRLDATEELGHFPLIPERLIHLYVGAFNFLYLLETQVPKLFQFPPNFDAETVTNSNWKPGFSVGSSLRRWRGLGGAGKRIINLNRKSPNKVAAFLPSGKVASVSLDLPFIFVFPVLCF